MSFPLLARRIALLTALIAVVVVVLHSFGMLGELAGFTWFCLLYFFLLSLLMMGLATLAKGSLNPGTKNFVFLGTIMFKSMLTLFLVLAYFFLYRPETPTFIIPLGLMYVVYSLLTTSALMQISRSV